MLWKLFAVFFCLLFVENIFQFFCVGKSDFDYSTEQNTAYAIHSRHCQIIRTWLSIKVWISSTNWSTIPKYRNALVKIPALASATNTSSPKHLFILLVAVFAQRNTRKQTSTYFYILPMIWKKILISRWKFSHGVKASIGEINLANFKMKKKIFGREWTIRY